MLPTDTKPKKVLEPGEMEFLQCERTAWLMLVDNIEKRLGTCPRTAELREMYRTGRLVFAKKTPEKSLLTP